MDQKGPNYNQTSQEKVEAFKDLLNNQHDWPCRYTFKFIVPSAKQSEVASLFPNDQVTTRESSEGAYTSLTADVMVESAEIVVAVYEKASKIEGLIAL